MNGFISAPIIIAGDKYQHDFYLEQDDQGTALNITGITYEVLLRKDDAAAGSAVGTATVLDGPAGLLRIIVDPTNTALVLAAGKTIQVRIRDTVKQITLFEYEVELKP